MLLKGKVAIVSGVGPGLGRQLAVAVAEQGAHVVMAARTESYLAEVCAEISDFGGRASFRPTDITSKDACDALAEHALSISGQVHALIHNAYNPYPFSRFESADLTHWRNNLEVNLFGALELTKALIPSMRGYRDGSIVFVNSLIAKKPYVEQGGYCTSKGALAAAARMLALELGEYGIRVNTMYPGWMWGPPVESFLQAQADEKEVPLAAAVEEVARRLPLGRIPTDRECANVAVFLASSLASAITGAGIDVNGGELMG